MLTCVDGCNRQGIDPQVLDAKVATAKLKELEDLLAPSNGQYTHA